MAEEVRVSGDKEGERDGTEKLRGDRGELRDRKNREGNPQWVNR